MRWAVAAVSDFRGQLLDWLKPVHRKLREQKVDLFLRLVGDSSAGDTLLDVGGGAGIDGEFLGPDSIFSRIIIVTLDTQHFQVPKNLGVTAVHAYGCYLPFKTKSFDCDFSNAVIEDGDGW